MTMVVPLYISEVTSAFAKVLTERQANDITGLYPRDSWWSGCDSTMFAFYPSRFEIKICILILLLVSVTIGILVSYWIDYGTNYVGGTRCAPDMPYTGGTSAKPTFDPYNDIPAAGCNGQSEASWRIPLALQIVPAVILGVGMIFFPESPRWLIMKERDDDALVSLSRLRRKDRDSTTLQSEYLEVRASIMLENSFARQNFPNLSGVRLHAAQVRASFAYLLL